ncbi:hypothetical protein DYB26_001893 [Aphanomyces astaci]|uniref:non-specific serine/threonine protein kinase n=1 Tax=Aphanomyces astaci TaxID=112090 RepID=A0A3R6WUN7_APHAT|nr:hypothetical protein DYB26_001893 [Aphanomyces astaci]
MKLDILKALAAAKSLAASTIGPATAAADKPSATPAVPLHEDDAAASGGLELRKSAKPKPSSSTAEPADDPEPTAALSESLLANRSEDDQDDHDARATPSPTPPAAAVTVASSAVVDPDNPLKASADHAALEFDMFALDDDVKVGVLSPEKQPDKVSLRPAVLALERHGNHDDSEGYYKANVGEVLNGDYRVMGTVGKGVFSNVLLCKCLKGDGDTTVAVKLIRNNDTMRDAAQLEVRLLTELQTGPRRSKYIVRLLNSFEYRSHAAMVFEPMQMNVREAMKKFGGRDGLALGGVKVFCRQLMLALDHLQTSNIVHADIKPDNMLLDDKQSMVKLCDFGSAFKTGAGEVNDPTPYLVSRYYRAPEVILGLPYDFPVDMWSLGCCLYEMFTGKVLFPGQTNNEMLKMFMELKGRFPTKLMRRHRQVYQEKFLMEPHFDEGLRFCSREIDRVTGTRVCVLVSRKHHRYGVNVGTPVVRTLNTIHGTKDLAAALMAAKSHSDDKKLLMELKDLLDKIFVIDPTKRLSVTDALQHPFVMRT